MASGDAVAHRSSGRPAESPPEVNPLGLSSLRAGRQPARISDADVASVDLDQTDGLEFAEHARERFRRVAEP